MRILAVAAQQVMLFAGSEEFIHERMIFALKVKGGSDEFHVSMARHGCSPGQ